MSPASPRSWPGSRVSSCDPSGGHGTSPRTSPCQSPGKRDATEAKSVSLKQSYSPSIHLVEEGVEGPGEEEADPANGHHDPHLARAQGVRDPVDVNQLHVLLHAQLCGNAQPGRREQNISTIGDWSAFMLVNCSLPEVEHEEHQEVDGLFDECWFVSNSFFGSWKIQTF